MIYRKRWSQTSGDLLFRVAATVEARGQTANWIAEKLWQLRDYTRAASGLARLYERRLERISERATRDPYWTEQDSLLDLAIDYIFHGGSPR